MGLYEDLDAAHCCFLKCGEVIFRCGDIAAIAAYTSGMQTLVNVIKKACLLLYVCTLLQGPLLASSKRVGSSIVLVRC